MATKKTTKKTTKKAAKKATKRCEEAPQRVPVLPTASTLPAPCERELSRDVVVEAVYLEGLEHGLSSLDAMRAAEQTADRLRLEGPVTDRSEKRFYDLVHEQDFTYPGGKRRVKIRGNAPVLRDIRTVDKIVLHQTAVEFGVAKYMVKKAKGNIELARARRALDVACHMMAFRKGYYVAAHDLRTLVNHAGRFNLTSHGLEIEGRYPGLKDDPSTMAREDLKTTWGGKPSVLTDATVEASCMAIDAMVKGTKDLGGEITTIVSHRQSSDFRRSDPGQEIWERVAIDYCEKELGLKLYLASPWRQGRPVPEAWDPRGSGTY